MHFSSGKIRDIFTYNDSAINNDDDFDGDKILEEFGVNNYNIIPLSSNLIENNFEFDKSIKSHVLVNNNNLLTSQIDENESQISNKEKEIEIEIEKEKENQIVPSNLVCPFETESYTQNKEYNLGNTIIKNNECEKIQRQNKEKIEYTKKKQNNYLNKKRRSESKKKKKKKKTGRKTNKVKSENSHTKKDSDNIQVKIQVHFVNFLIDLSNDALLTELGKNEKYIFKYINYESKRNIKSDYVETLKSDSIKNIIRKDINKKWKTLNKKYNEDLLEKVCLQSTWLDNFFNIKFLMAFEKYYYNERKLIDKINFEGKDIILSKKTECFYHLIEKNKDLEDKLNDIAKDVYMSNFKFMTSKKP